MTKQIPKAVRKIISQQRAQTALLHRARNDATLERIASDMRETPSTEVLNKLGFDVEKMRKRQAKALRDVRAYLAKAKKRPFPRHGKPAMPRLWPAPGSSGAAPHPPQPWPGPYPPPPQWWAYILDRCIYATPMSSTEGDCEPDIRNNIMRIYSEDDGQLEFIFGRPHVRPSTNEVEMWFLTRPVELDGYVTITPFVHIRGWENLWVHDEWFASGYGQVTLSMQTSISAGGGELSSVTTLIDDRGSNKNIHYVLDDVFVLNPVAIPVNSGDQVVIHLTAWVNTECTNGFAELDLCHEGPLDVGIQGTDRACDLAAADPDHVIFGANRVPQSARANDRG